MNFNSSSYQNQTQNVEYSYGGNQDFQQSYTYEYQTTTPQVVTKNANVQMTTTSYENRRPSQVVTQQNYLTTQGQTQGQVIRQSQYVTGQQNVIRQSQYVQPTSSRVVTNDIRISNVREGAPVVVGENRLPSRVVDSKQYQGNVVDVIYGESREIGRNTHYEGQERVKETRLQERGFGGRWQ